MSGAANHAAADSNQRLVCAVLAAHVAALRDRVHTASAVEHLWRASDTLSQLSDRAGDAAAGAVTTVAEIRRELEDLAFLQAQSQDFVSQMADCVVIALQRMAAAGARLPPGDLVALYVCEDQRRVHEEAASQFYAN